MRNRYLDSRECVLEEFREMAHTLRVPIGDAPTKGTSDGVEIVMSSFRSSRPHHSTIALGLLAVASIAVTTIRVSGELQNGAELQKRKPLKVISTTEDDVEKLTDSFEAQFERIDFEHNKANALLIDRHGMHPVEVIDTEIAQESTCDKGSLEVLDDEQQE